MRCRKLDSKGSLSEQLTTQKTMAIIDSWHQESTLQIDYNVIKCTLQCTYQQPTSQSPTLPACCTPLHNTLGCNRTRKQSETLVAHKRACQWTCGRCVLVCVRQTVEHDIRSGRSRRPIIIMLCRRVQT